MFFVSFFFSHLKKKIEMDVGEKSDYLELQSMTLPVQYRRLLALACIWCRVSDPTKMALSLLFEHMKLLVLRIQQFAPKIKSILFVISRSAHLSTNTNYMSRISQIVSTIFLRDKMFWLDKNSIKVPIYIADCITKKADRNSLKKVSEKCVEPFSSIRNSKYHCNLTIIS